MPETKTQIVSQSNRYHPVIRLMVFLLLLSTLLFAQPQSTEALATWLPFGGRLLFTTPAFTIPPTQFTPLIVCPSIAHILNLGPGSKYLNFMLPPTQPKANYNFYLPSVAVLGSYLPKPVTAPIQTNCFFQPIFPSVYFGTGAL